MEIVPHPHLPLGKTCKRCRVWKLFEEFYKNRSRADGLNEYCKPCWSVLSNESRQRHLEARRKKAREWARETYPEKREERLQRARDWYAKSGGVDWHRQWRADNPDRVRALRKARYLADPQKRLAESKHRLAMRRGAEGSHTQAEWEALCDACGGVCLACGEAKPLTRDHVIPLTKGGGDGIDNIQPLCMTCNARKNDRATDYRQRAG